MISYFYSYLIFFYHGLIVNVWLFFLTQDGVDCAWASYTYLTLLVGLGEMDFFLGVLLGFLN